MYTEEERAKFRLRFAAWKDGKKPYEAGLPVYRGGKDPYDDTIDFLKQYEGFKDTTYLDGNGVPTIGYGFTDSSLVKKGKISLAEADKLLRKEVLKRESNLQKLKHWDKLSENSKTALRSYYYNYPAGFKDTTKFIKYWNAGDFESAIKEVDAGINDKKNPGLRTRRLKEQLMLRLDPFLTRQASPLVRQLEEQPSFLPVLIQVPIDRTDYSLQNASMLSSAPQAINAWKGKGSPAYGGYSLRMPSIQEYMLTGNVMPRGFKDGKLPKYGDGTPTKVGDYNVYPSAIGASELNVTTPEVIVTGIDRRPLYLRYDAPNSSYNTDDIVKGFNALTLGGLNNLSPTQWARRFYDAPKLFSGDMSFSDYTNRWLNGNEGIVSANFEKTHPYVSMAINGGADILTGAAANKLLQLNKLSRLQKMYTSVPKTVDKVTGEVMPDLFRKGYSGTVWTSNNPDYGYYLTNGGETFDVYFDPKKLNLLDAPYAPEGTYFVWNRLPFKGKGGKIQVNPKAEVDDTAFMYNTKDDALANTDKFGILLKSHGALHPLIEPRLMNKNTLGFKEGLKTDHIVRYSKMLNRDGVKFHNVYDGGAEDLHGFLYDTPLEEVVLNPGAEYFWTEHDAGLKGLFNKMPYKNVLGYSTTGAASNMIRTVQNYYTQNELRNK